MKTETPKHSPLPWNISTNGHAKESGKEPAFPGVRDSSGLEHGQDIVCIGLGTPEQCVNNSSFIILSANAHYELVEALEWFVEAYQLNGGQNQIMLNKATAALAKARGGE